MEIKLLSNALFYDFYFKIILLFHYLKIKSKPIPKSNDYKNLKQVNQTVYQVGNDMRKTHFTWL